MLIRVIYQDYKYDFIKANRLDEFITSGKVAMFRRRSGWAIVGIDPIRREEDKFFRIGDRRTPGA